jgi:L-fuculose-phosphate aldolase
MAARHLALRRDIVATARKMNALGINRGRSGNVSARIEGGVLITPSGVPYDELRPEDIVRLRFDGSHEGRLLPSSEWRFHVGILAARPEAGALVHSHSNFATALACLGRGIPAFHYEVALAGGPDIRCAPYATFGTEELAANAVAAIAGRKACLLANHGVIAIGPGLAQALDVAVKVEALAEQYWAALQVGEPAILSPAEMAVVLKKYETYGKQPSAKRRATTRRK